MVLEGGLGFAKQPESENPFQAKEVACAKVGSTKMRMMNPCVGGLGRSEDQMCRSLYVHLIQLQQCLSEALVPESYSPTDPQSIRQEGRQRLQRCILGILGEKSRGPMMNLIPSELWLCNFLPIVSSSPRDWPCYRWNHFLPESSLGLLNLASGPQCFQAWHGFL